MTSDPIEQEVEKKLNLLANKSKLPKTIRLVEEFIEAPDFKVFIIKNLEEIEKSLQAELSMSAIALCGSILEALLLNAFSSINKDKEGKKICFKRLIEEAYKDS